MANPARDARRPRAPGHSGKAGERPAGESRRGRVSSGDVRRGVPGATGSLGKDEWDTHGDHEIREGTGKVRRRDPGHFGAVDGSSGDDRGGLETRGGGLATLGERETLRGWLGTSGQVAEEPPGRPGRPGEVLAGPTRRDRETGKPGEVARATEISGFRGGESQEEPPRGPVSAGLRVTGSSGHTAPATWSRPKNDRQQV